VVVSTTVELTPAQREADSRDWTFGGTWPYEPRWVHTDGIRLHYVDEGPRDGEPVVMLHGNPTWSYLYRNFIPPLIDAGYRAIAHDQLGFGRSDKPKRRREYTAQRQSALFAAVVDELSLDDVTLVLHDWGGPVGLSWAVDNPDRVKRLVVLNTFTGAPPEGMETPFVFKLVLMRGTGELLVKGAHAFVRQLLFKRGVAHPERLGDDEHAAYLAPHPSWDSRAGVLAYPRLIAWDAKSPTRPLVEHIATNLPRLRDTPVLICWAMQDVGFGEAGLAQWREVFPTAEVAEIDGASHFLQEDAHEQIVPRVLDFLERTS
jgi:cis-3-alkyl-4-acyloxetan-2-one decarboxylase